jgi:WD40 repeat protein
MRFLRILLLLLCLLCSPAALSQTKPVLQHKGDFGFLAQDEHISWHKYLERENQLLLVSEKNLQLLDIGNAKVLENRPITLPPLSMRANYSTWEISPDGRKMLIIERPDKKKGAQQQQEDAWVQDLQTGKRLAVLDKSPTRIRSGAWSKNGQTLVTYDYDMIYDTSFKVAISFWDGETLEYRQTITVNNITWTYLSDDGKRFFAASGRKKSFFGLKFISDSHGVINVWDTSSGQIEKTIAVSNKDFNIKTTKISVSPDGKYLVFATKHKSKSAENRLLVWEIDGRINPKYEIKANPKIDNSHVSFSPDAKYFAVDAGKTLQIYETQTGAKRFELQNVELSVVWLNDNNTLLEDETNKMRAFELANGKQLYEQPLVYQTATETVGSGTTDSMGNYVPAETRTIVTDYTRIIPHPNGKMFLTYSSQYVKVFDARTGVLLQTLVSPELAAPSADFCLKYPKKCQGNLVWKAGWSNDGKTLYVFNSNLHTVSLWGLLEN